MQPLDPSLQEGSPPIRGLDPHCFKNPDFILESRQSEQIAKIELRSKGTT